MHGQQNIKKKIPLCCHAMSTSGYLPEFARFSMSSSPLTCDTKTLLKIWKFYYQYF